MKYTVGEVQFEKDWVENELPKIGWTPNLELCNKDVSSIQEHFKELLEQKYNIKFNEIEWSKLCEKLDEPSLVKRMNFLREPINFVLEDNSSIDLILIDWFNPQNNTYEVIYETTDNNKRYDVSFLINGIPLLHCELKKPGYIDIWTAFNQIKRYKKSGMHWLYKYTNMYMISDGFSSMFFANNDLINEKNPKSWTDEKNNKIGRIQELHQYFLKPETVLDYLNRFCLIDKKQLILARPYQYYAVQKCFNQILNTKESGYIFHATGSGKTLTSFLLSRDLSRHEKIDKVIFVVDRKDLGDQTQKEFSKYSAFGSNILTKYDVENTTDLIEKLLNKNEKLIITSIQKLDRACKAEDKQKIVETIRNKKLVFIYDECHRSQAGDMRKHINDIFNNPQTIGFTGTPIYLLSQTTSGLRTEDIFGECLHTYSICDAIGDSNIVSYNIKFPVNLKWTDEAMRKKADTLKWEEFFIGDKWIESVCSYIKDTFMDLTQNKTYGAMLTVGSIDEAYKCWKWFKTNFPDINVGCIFSVEPNGEETGEDNKTSCERLKDILVSFNNETGANYSLNNYYSYQENLSDRIRNGNIDLTIVVNIFTTGFDAPRINTVYVARSLKMHNVIQTFARACRNYEKKQFANVRCLLRTNKRAVDEAFSYYAKGVEIEKIMPPDVNNYQKIVASINQIIDEILAIAPNPNVARNNTSEEFIKKFMVLIRKLAFNLDNFFLVFDEKSWTDLHMTYEQILEYRSIAGSFLQQYKEIIAKDDTRVNPDRYIEEITIDELISKSTNTTNDWLTKISKSKTKEKQKELLNLLIKELDKRDMKTVAELIKEYLDWYIDSMPDITPSDTKQQIDIKMEEKWNELIKNLANKYSLDFEYMKEYYKKYKDNIITKQEKDKMHQRVREKFNEFDKFKKVEEEILNVFETIKIQQEQYENFDLW